MPLPLASMSVCFRGFYADIARVIETAMRVILRATEDFEVNGFLQYSRMPELEIISCTMRFT